MRLYMTSLPLHGTQNRIILATTLAFGMSCSPMPSHASVDFNGMPLDVWSEWKSGSSTKLQIVPDEGGTNWGKVAGCQYRPGTDDNPKYPYVLTIKAPSDTGSVSGSRVMISGYPSSYYPTNGEVTVPLMDASGTDTGWRFGIGYPDAELPILPAAGRYRLESKVRLKIRGNDLTPGHTYHVPSGFLFNSLTVFDYVDHHDCGTRLSHVADTDLSGVQTDTSTTSVSFSDATHDAGVIDDGATITPIRVSVVGLASQTAAIRWATAGYTPLSDGSYLGDRYNSILGDNGNVIVLGLDCGESNNNMYLDPVHGNPSFVVSGQATLQCTVVKAGTAEVFADRYPMSIEIGAYTP